MRKNAGFMMLTLLLLIVPALANAWTLTVKVAGGNANNSVAVTYPTSTALATTATKTVKSGTAYLYPTKAGVTAVIAAGTPAPVITLDGAAYVPATLAALTSGNHVLQVVYPADSTTGLNLTQAVGGQIYAQNRNNTWSAAGVSGLPANTIVNLTISADNNYAITGYKVNNGATVPASGKVYSFALTADNQTVQPVFAVDAKISASLFAPTNAVAGNDVTLSVAATTNDTGLEYAFSTDNGVTFTAFAAVASYTFEAAEGTTKVQAKVKTANGGSFTTPVASIVVANAQAAANSQCTSCHSTQSPAVIAAYNTTAGHMNSNNISAGLNSCATCHTNTPHDKGASCVGCHAFALNAGAGFVQDNNGVRAITGEFEKRSHHVTGREVKDSDCAVCHLEGKKSGNVVVVDTAYHMVDDKIYLRNGNSALVGNQTEAVGAGYPWRPSNPDHTLMDQFCFSCHNAAGAPDAAAALAGVTGYTGTALNPFGDTISNSYDQVLRPAVVGVYEQFDTNNSSHHAVRGQKYTSKTLSAQTFTNISTANAAALEGGVAKPQKGVKSVIGTMFSLGKFTATYTTLNGVALADDNVLHCGDCHTVGQFRAADVDLAAGSFNKAVIGAHGSENEYMLRNSNGDDVFNKDALVCYICHKQNLYGKPTSQGGTEHNGVNSDGVHCNGDVYNTAGMVGVARLVPDEGLGMTDEEFQHEVAEGKYQATGGGSILGIKCLLCHNASDKKTFGGIHGNAGNASYTTYSGAKNVDGVVKTVNRKPYRFMPGLGNFRYNGGDSAEQWTMKSVSQANKQGCYTLNGTSATRGGLGKQPTQAVASGANTGAYNAATGVMGTASGAPGNDNGILGSWGACTDHAGTSVFGGRAATRNLLRPLTY